jgi:antitoxin MazE
VLLHDADEEEVVVQIRVKKWGNSASIRIPGALMAAAHLQLDQAVDLREEDGRLVIEPIRPAPYDLAGLLAGVTDENLHDAADMGPPIGAEIW